MLTVRIVVIAAIVIAVTGALATALGDDWDLFALFAVLTFLQVAFGLVLFGPRRIFSVRSDLAQWLDERAALTGEAPQRILDRCVAAYRAGLFVSDE